MKKVLFVGAPSTGKSTISKLACEKISSAVLRPELGIEFIKTLGINGPEEYTSDMHFLLTQDLISREKTIQRSHPDARYLFCDCGAITTLAGHWSLYNKIDKRIENLINKNDYDIYFLCNNDIPTKADGFRGSSEICKKMQDLIMDILKNNNIKAILLNGSIENRLNIIKKTLGDKTQ